MRQTKIETVYRKEWMMLRNRKLRETEYEKGGERVRKKKRKR